MVYPLPVPPSTGINLVGNLQWLRIALISATASGVLWSSNTVNSTSCPWTWLILSTRLLTHRLSSCCFGALMYLPAPVSFTMFTVLQVLKIICKCLSIALFKHIHNDKSRFMKLFYSTNKFD